MTNDGEWSAKTEAALADLADGVANLDLYEYEIEVTWLEDDGRPQVRYTLTMPCTQASEDLLRLSTRKTGFAAVVAQVFFFHIQEKATRKMRKAIQPHLRRTLKAAKKIAKR